MMTLAYPRHLHRPVSRADWDAGKRDYRVVTSASECAEALEQGWSLVPILIDPAASPVEAPSAPVSEPVEASPSVVTPFKRRGRPPKAVNG